MSQEIEWKFPSNDGGRRDGFNEGAIDHFKGSRLSSIVREIIQNSLDARKDKDSPVVVNFHSFTMLASECPEVMTLKNSLTSCQKEAKTQRLEDAVKFYDNALKKIDQKEINFLAVHDSNTKGLEGDINGSEGSWVALVKGAGISQKSENSLGSFGHGSSAPFVSSAIRSIFYLTYIKNKNKIEKRFQGKSILQSHKQKDGDGYTQGTGFYGESKGCNPLLEEKIPAWATEARVQKCKDETGTTIFIPHFSQSKDSANVIAKTIIANFYYAISHDNLKVFIDDNIALTADSVKSLYNNYMENLSSADEDDADNIKGKFENLQALVNPTQQNTQKVTNLGSFKWFLNLNENLEQTRVAIARQNGMLITHNPVNLKQFPSSKSFEMFVCVDGPGGSDLLKTIENPQHDDFKFERIDNEEDQKKARRLYKNLTDKIRAIIREHTEEKGAKKYKDSTFSDLFENLFSDELADEGEERSKNIILRASAAPRKKQQATKTKDSDGIESDEGGYERQGSKSSKSSQAGQGTLPNRGVAGGDPSLVLLENIRIVSDPSDAKIVTLNFDNPGSGDYDLRLFKKGESRIVPIEFKKESEEAKPNTQKFITTNSNSRQAITLHLLENVEKFAIEAKVRQRLPEIDQPEGGK